MRFDFAEQHLRRLYTMGIGARRYPPEVVEAFFDAVATIEAATDERDLYAAKGFHYEKLRGKRTGQRSLRLNKQWRLIVTPARDQDGPLVWIIEITDYH